MIDAKISLPLGTIKILAQQNTILIMILQSFNFILLIFQIFVKSEFLSTKHISPKNKITPLETLIYEIVQKYYEEIKHKINEEIQNKYDRCLL